MIPGFVTQQQQRKQIPVPIEFLAFINAPMSNYTDAQYIVICTTFKNIIHALFNNHDALTKMEPLVTTMETSLNDSTSTHNTQRQR